MHGRSKHVHQLLQIVDRVSLHLDQAKGRQCLREHNDSSTLSFIHLSSPLESKFTFLTSAVTSSGWMPRRCTYCSFSGPGLPSKPPQTAPKPPTIHDHFVFSRLICGTSASEPPINAQTAARTECIARSMLQWACRDSTHLPCLTPAPPCSQFFCSNCR